MIYAITLASGVQYSGFENFLHEEMITVSSYLLSPYKIVIMLYITSL